ncbi:MAG: hypothetical protein ACRDTD_26950 [Pseudonocardiaceae bacterium]
MTAKIGLIATLLAALIAATATVVVALINYEPTRTPADPSPPGVVAPGARMPEPICATCTPGGKTFTQQVNTSNPAGTTTFRDPRGFAGQGPRVLPGQRVEVVCRFLDPNAPASVRPGWWYLVDSSPWNRQYYTPANSYLNGDPPEGPYVSGVDGRVPVC